MTTRPRPLPPSFAVSAWRGTTACDTFGGLGVSFDLPDGSIVRLALDRQSAQQLSQSVRQYLDGYNSVRPHSDNSSGRPSVEVSTPAAGANV